MKETNSKHRFSKIKEGIYMNKLKTKKIFKYLAIIAVISLIVTLMFMVEKIHYDVKKQWQTAEAKTYKPTDKEEIYVVAYKKNIENIIKGDFASAKHSYPYMNQKESIYKTPSFVDELFGINTYYVVKKEGDKVSIGELHGNIIDERKDRTKPFNVTIKKLNDNYRVILENEKEPQPKEITYTSEGLP